MSKHKTRKEGEKLGKAIAAALVSGGVITSEQAKNAQIVVGGHKKNLRTEPRKPHNISNGNAIAITRLSAASNTFHKLKSHNPHRLVGHENPDPTGLADPPTTATN